MPSRTLRSALIAGFGCLASIHAAAAQIIPNPNMSPTPTIPPIIGIPTPTPPPTPNPAVLLKADPQLARALVRYGQNGVLSLASDRGRFQKVALQPNEVVTVVLNLSPKDYGQPADVQVLDGGAMTTSVPKPVLPATPTPFPTAGPPLAPPNSTTNATPTIPPTPTLDPSTLTETGKLMAVSLAGELVFAFKPGADVGLHRVLVVVGGNQYFLQFWRQDPSAPNNNSRMLRAY